MSKVKDRARRQAYALANPISDPSRASTEPYKLTRNHASGLMLMTILAVDR